MKKKTLLILLVSLTIILMGVNLYDTQAEQAQYKATSIVVKWSDGGAKTLLSRAQLTQMPIVPVEAFFQRKVGPRELKHYEGIALPLLLAQLGVSKEQITGVAITSRDQYRIVLTPEEVFDEGNVYLVLKEDQKPLAPEEGAYKLVICRDALSTRWVKQVVSIELLR